MKKFCYFILLIIMFSLTMAGCVVGNEMTVDIAVVGPLTGDAAFWGNQLFQGVKLAVEEINSSGGVKRGPYEGAKYKIVGPFDDRGDPAEAANIAGKIATMDNVLAVIGPVNSSNAFSMVPILNRAGIPVISGGASSKDLTKQGWKTFFRPFLPDSGVAQFMAKLFDKLGYKRVVVAYSNNDFGRGIFEHFKKQAQELGIEILSEEGWRPGQDRDFSAIVTKWITLKPDAVFIAGEYTESGLIVKQARASGLDVPILNQGAYGPDFLQIVGEYGEGVIVQTHFSPFSKDEITQFFVRKFADVYGETPAENGAIGYNDIIVLNDAIYRMEKKGRPALLKALRETKGFQSMLFEITFDETGEILVPDRAPLTIIRNGKYEAFEP